MLLDHIGAFFYPWSLLRIIGRISFPLFAYQLSVGCQATSNRKNYIKRLLFFAAVSQIPFYFLRGEIVLNILFSLSLGIFAISAIEKKKFFYIFLSFFASFFVEYGPYGLSVILIFYFFKKNIHKFSLFSLSTFLYSVCYQIHIQLFALFSLPFILGPKMKVRLPKYFFYIFYPAHLIILYLIKTALHF